MTQLVEMVTLDRLKNGLEEVKICYSQWPWKENGSLDKDDNEVPRGP